jgi:hypothetical protein
MDFNNREVAAGCWVGALTLFALAHRSVRESLHRVAAAFLRVKVALPFTLLGLYTVIATRVLEATGLWTGPLLKDTILWFLFSGVALVAGVVTGEQSEDLLKRVLRDNLKVIVLLQFLVATYTFSLPIELALVPLVSVLATIGVVAKSDQQLTAVARLARSLQAFVGVTVISSAIVKTATHYSEVGNFGTVRQLLLAPVLSVLLIPFVYALGLYARYELLFLRLRLGPDTDRSLKLYARWRLIRHLRLNLRRVTAFLHVHGPELTSIRSRADLDRLLKECD